MGGNIPFRKKHVFRKPWFLFFLLIIFGALSWYGYLKYKGTAPIEYETITAERSTLIQEVSSTGRVEAVKSVDLAFEVGGRIAETYADVGDIVKPGQELIRMENADLKAQLNQAKAGVTSAWAQLQQYSAAIQTAKANLEELKKGSRQEEINISQTTVQNARIELEDALTNLENIKSGAEADLAEDYNNALISLPGAALEGKEALITLSEIQYDHFNGSDTDSNRISAAKQRAMQALFSVANAGKWETKYISTQMSGVFSEAQSASSGLSHESINDILDRLIDALQKIKSTLDTIPFQTSLSSTEKSSLNSAKTSINSEISALSSKRQTIRTQKTVNSNNISNAETQVNTARNAMTLAQNQLLLTKAGPTQEQIDAQESLITQAQANYAAQSASVNQAQANQEYYQARLEKTILRAPIAGVITRMEANPGEIVLPSSTTYEIQKPLVTIISEGEYEIKTNIAEVDIAKIEIGDSAKITLDALGDEIVFDAVVMAIDPAETMTEGLATYETTLTFLEKDERVKSGMTANIDILTAKKEDVIVVPQRVVVTKESKKYIKVLMQDDEGIEKPEEIEVETGLRGSMGEVEIISGLNEGDKIVVK